MDLSSPESMARFAADVRRQQGPFTAAAAEAFAQVFASEYQRLRAAQVETGSEVAVLNMTLRCDFAKRSVVVLSAPAPVTPRTRQRCVQVAD